MIAELRINREGRTCMVLRKRQDVFMIRMKEGPLEVESPTEPAIAREYPTLVATTSKDRKVAMTLRSSAAQYLIHGAVSGACKQAVDLLCEVHRPPDAVLSKIKYTDQETPKC